MTPPKACDHRFRCVLALALAATAGACRPAAEDPKPPDAPLELPAGALFVDGSAASGLDFVHFNGMSGELYFCEMAGAGAALFDYDNDGDLDAYLVQGHMLGPGKSLADALFQPRMPLPLVDQLYRNDLEVRPDGSRALRFTNVTAQSGLRAGGYGMGVATGDYDNDGWIDLYVTNFGSNQMWRNNGDGSFSDVTAQTGTDDPRWSSSAAFFDYDRDGYLDLYVANYVNFRLSNHKTCRTQSGRPDYCGPQSYEGVTDRLLHNRGDGSFEDVSGAAGMLSEPSSGLGVVTGDFDADGWIDLYVANDERRNFLWMNQGDGTFRNEAMLAGCAVNAAGQAQSSMGVDSGDLDNDGDEDLYMTHIDNDSNTLYLNNGQGLFEDRTASAGLDLPTLPYTGFGTSFVDFDNDGWIDILAVNGAVRILEEQAAAGSLHPLAQPDQLFRNLGRGRLVDVSGRAGAVFQLQEVSRGAALGDVDNDGDIDALVSNNAGPARLLINQVGQRRAWLGLRLVSAELKRDLLGAEARLYRSAGPVLQRRARSDGSYLSAKDPRVLFGLGAAAGAQRVVVRWPDGSSEEFGAIGIGRYTTLTQGAGRKVVPQ